MEKQHSSGVAMYWIGPTNMAAKYFILERQILNPVFF